MEDRKTLFDYAGQVFIIFGFSIVVLNLFCTLVGEYAQNVSSIYSMGKEGLSTATMMQFLGVSVCITGLRFLFFTDKVIREMSITVRTVSMLLSIIGLIVVCAAGNGGPDPMTISPLGARRKVITVGCHEGGYFGNQAYLCENYSGRGPSPYDMKKPDVVAPGTDIVSCNAFWERRGRSYRRAYTSKSGTSMATPIISGALALLLQKYPYYNNESAKRKLQSTAKDLNEPWSKQGYGMVQINSLLT